MFEQLHCRVVFIEEGCDGYGFKGRIWWRAMSRLLGTDFIRWTMIPVRSDDFLRVTLDGKFCILSDSADRGDTIVMKL